MIGIESLDTLCKVLKCKPNDLLQFVDDESKNETGNNESVIDESNNNTATLSSNILSSNTLSSNNLDEKMYSMIEAGNRLGVSRKSVNDYVNKGKLKAVKINGKNFVREADLIEFEKDRKDVKK